MVLKMCLFLGLGSVLRSMKLYEIQTNLFLMIVSGDQNPVHTFLLADV